ncbi:unnamed protein product, partial [Mesorhabditis belari]|uniref:ornithine decarboxylase n=1 Tax=Mesorhabditis belari TaxID=2138241 RepID=A0AAF3JAX0_9BILA
MAEDSWIHFCNGEKVVFENQEIAIFPSIESMTLCRKIASFRDKNNNKKGFMLYNLDHLVKRFELWKEEFPMVEPFYATKANNDPVILRILTAFGCSFDCASQNEIDLLIKLGASPSQIIFAHPAKTEESILFAKAHDVKLLVVDSVEELLKQSRLFPGSKSVIRISASSSQSISDLSVKFGADPEEEAPEIIKIGAKEGINIHGISFHVGTGCEDPAAIPRALRAVKKLILMGREAGHEMKLVDIGGGFNGYNDQKFRECAAGARPTIEALKEELDLRFIAEPGRYIVAPCASICVNVQLGKEVSAAKITGNPADKDKRGIEYYITSSVFGTFVCCWYGYLNSEGRPLFPKGGEQFVSRIWGPTCDSKDQIETNKMMERLVCGDWIYYDFKGAYTTVYEAPFNGFPHPEHLFASSEKVWDRIKETLL